MQVPVLGAEGRNGGGGGRGAGGRDGGTLGAWESPDGRGRWVSRRVTAVGLVSREVCVKKGGGK